jgi:hypothetical protein
MRYEGDEASRHQDKYEGIKVSGFFGSALGSWVREGWDWLFIFLQDMLLQ